MPKLFYIVNINLDGLSARSVQVISNSLEFSKLLGSRFELIAPGETQYEFHNGKNVFGIQKEKSVVRKIIFHIKVFLCILKIKKDSIIYSRNLSILMMAQSLGKKIVWEAHDQPRGLNDLILRFLVKRNLRVIAISEALNKRLQLSFKVLSDRVSTQHDAVSLDQYKYISKRTNKSQIRGKWQLPDPGFILMHSGSIDAGRGAEIFEIVLEKVPDIYLVHVGGLPKDLAFWEDRYANYQNIRFISRQGRESLIELQLCADAFLLPMTKQSSIWWCTSPMKLFEYAAAKAPIIHTGIGSITEILHSKNSLEFSLDNSDSLVRSINYLKDDPGAGEALALEAYRIVSSKHTWEKRVQNIIAFCSIKLEQPYND